MDSIPYLVEWFWELKETVVSSSLCKAWNAVRDHRMLLRQKTMRFRSPFATLVLFTTASPQSALRLALERTQAGIGVVPGNLHHQPTPSPRAFTQRLTDAEVCKAYLSLLPFKIKLTLSPRTVPERNAPLLDLLPFPLLLLHSLWVSLAVLL